MNYVQFHWGDWVRSTQDLTPLERGIYIDLLQRYYQKERPLTDDECSRIARAYRDEEQKAMQYVLQTFFKREANAWRHDRCDEEIAKFNDISAKRSAAGRKSRASKDGVTPNKIAEKVAIAEQVQSKCLANDEQLLNKCTSTHYPLPITQESNNPLTPLQGEKGEVAIASNVGSKEKERKRGTRLTLEKLPDEWRAYCEQEDPELDPDRVWADFRDYWTAKAGSGAVKLDWERTWQTNVRSYRDAPDWKRKPVLKPQTNEIDYSGWLTGDLG